MKNIKKQRGFVRLVLLLLILVTGTGLAVMHKMFSDTIKAQEKKEEVTQEAISNIPHFTNELYSDLNKLKEISKSLANSKDLDDNFVKVKEFIVSPALKRVKESNNKEAGNVKLTGINIANDINITQYINNSISDDDSIVELNIDSDSIIDADWHYRTRVINGYTVNDICVNLNEAITTDSFSGNIYKTNCKGEEGKSASILYNRIQTFNDIVDFNKEPSNTEDLVWIRGYDINGSINIDGDLEIIAEVQISNDNLVKEHSYEASLEKKVREDKIDFEYIISMKYYSKYSYHSYISAEFKIL